MIVDDAEKDDMKVELQTVHRLNFPLSRVQPRVRGCFSGERVFHQNSPKGMTLIELLMAIAIAGLLALVAFMVYSSVLKTIQAQTLRHNTSLPAVKALDVLNRDLTCSMILFGESNAPFLLNSGTDGKTTTQLCFTTGIPGSSDTLRHYEIYRVCYMLRSANDKAVYSLVRQYRPFRVSLSDENVLEEELVKNVKMFQVEVFDGDKWTNQWGTKPDDGIPCVARVTIDIGHDDHRQTIQSEVLIPAGNRISVQSSR